MRQEPPAADGSAHRNGSSCMHALVHPHRTTRTGSSARRDRRPAVRRSEPARARRRRVRRLRHAGRPRRHHRGDRRIRAAPQPFRRDRGHHHPRRPRAGSRPRRGRASHRLVDLAAGARRHPRGRGRRDGMARARPA